MKIRIQKVSEGLYSAELLDLPEWTTPAPMNAHDLCRELLARGLHPTDVGDAFEEADPELMPRQREYVPTVGEEVLVLNRLGSFMVEKVDAELKTASLRVLRSGAPMKDVEWSTIWPLDDETRGLLKEIAAGGPVNGKVLRKVLYGRK